MSVQTEADNYLDSAKRNIQHSIEDLSHILINDCPGHDEWNETATGKMHEAFALVQKAKRLLK